MRFSTQQRRGMWGPKALAVVSFALALLAMQPMAGTAAPVAAQPTIIKEVGAALPAESKTDIAPAKATKTQWRIRETVPAAHLHILATVEILQRLLFAELNIQPERMPLSGLPCFDLICLEVLPPATEVRIHPAARFEASAPPLPPPAERTFAISRFLLAPPTV